MESHKKSQLKRRVETPEWADEIKPSEDVMSMFYAPTGVPKSGPLIPVPTQVEQPHPSERQDSAYIAPVQKKLPPRTLVTEKAPPVQEKPAETPLNKEPSDESLTLTNGPLTLDWEEYLASIEERFRMNKGETGVLRELLRQTHAIGNNECYVKVPYLAEAANIKVRRCQYVLRRLEKLQIIAKLRDYDPATRLGLQYRVNLIKTQLISG
jgi:hypothetical protein